MDEDGNYLLSARGMATVYHINGTDGEVLWKLGGRNSTFHMGTECVLTSILPQELLESSCGLTFLPLLVARDFGSNTTPGRFVRAPKRLISASSIMGPTNIGQRPNKLVDLF